jgi:hypothetical protein
VVVSNDRELGERLPSGVIRIEPGELFRRLQGPAGPQTDRPPPGDYSDIEKHFLSLEPPKPAPRARRSPPPRSRPASPRSTRVRPAGQRPSAPRPKRSASQRTPPPPPRPGAREAAPPGRDSEALARKKARGRRKQDRRLAQPGKRKRRRRGR